jgi:class 3 adenylate cyclase
MAPGMDEHFARWWAARARASCSPAAARDLILMNSQMDVRDVLPAIQVPALVLHRTGDRDAKVEEGRYLASRIPGARFVELPGDVHVPWWHADDILDQLEEFVTGAPARRLADRVLATMLFTDIVGSTDAVRTLGDHEWADVLARHHASFRAELARYGGEEIDEAGDGFFALFDGPARAVRCAESVREALRPLGVQIRAGVHTGEIERPRGGRPRGIAVHTGARIAAAAEAGEILVSSTTHDLVAGSGLELAPRGEMELKGIGAQRVYRVGASPVAV